MTAEITLNAEPNAQMASRLFWHLMYSPSVWAFKWIEECGHYKVLIIRNKEAFKLWE